ncbi:MAG TPA: FGGY family carbohydrate kinase [Roseiflexaceae bacterium]|nr:FGGY family carbohydrate kinase [Roseiflexaceae bacterium]
MALLVVDVGTTHCKAGLFHEDGRALQLASARMPSGEVCWGSVTYAPEAVWQTVLHAIHDAITAAGRPAIAAVGIASMAETGLLLDRRSGAPRTPFFPWFDPSAEASAEQFASHGSELERFRAFGIYASFKCSLAKALWVRDHATDALDDATWLSVADYVAYRMTGQIATDPSLAGRTYAFNLAERRWHDDWLQQFNLSADLFPPVLPSGTPVGTLSDAAVTQLGLQHGVPVVIAGHDHVCAAFGAGATLPGCVFDSMGTAEALVGTLHEQTIDERMARSGLTFGIMPFHDGLYWIGGCSASGGSLEWISHMLSDPPLSYEQIAALEKCMDAERGDIIYLPHLRGSGAPCHNPAARGAFIGLSASHTRADLLKAVLEGTAYQMELIRQAAEAVTDQPVQAITAAGGGTRNRRWLQIKADVYGAPIHIPATDEATLFGAALIAGIGCGVYRDADEALAVAAAQPGTTIEPDMERHQMYMERFEQFAKWQRAVCC